MNLYELEGTEIGCRRKPCSMLGVAASRRGSVTLGFSFVVRFRELSKGLLQEVVGGAILSSSRPVILGRGFKLSRLPPILTLV